MTGPARLRRLRLPASACALVAALLAAAPATATAPRASASHLRWAPCADAPAVQCALITVPLDYDRPRAGGLDLAVTRTQATDPAHRIGTLFWNPGGPGGSPTAAMKARGSALFPRLSARYDIVGFDPRGTGASDGAFDCHADQEAQGLYAQPFASPLDLDANALVGRARAYVQRCLSANRREVLEHASTANAARDMDVIRGALGEKRLNYLGFSYGTVLGATYASLFPRNYDRFVLDGPVDADAYINDPLRNLDEQTQGFERALQRFLAACAADQVACSGFGGVDPGLTYDALVEQADAAPIPAGGYAPDPRPVDGADIDWAVTGALYRRDGWGRLAYALATAADGDGSLVRALADGAYGRRADGSYDPGLDRYFLIGAVEQRFSQKARRVLGAGDRAFGLFAHFAFNTGYAALPYAQWPIRDRDAFAGPFRIPAEASTPLVVATVYDPATPLAGARRLVRDLGNARLLRVRGDGHTAYGRTGPCADAAIDAYLLAGTLPAAGTTCAAEQPFTRYRPAPSLAPAVVPGAGGEPAVRLLRPVGDAPAP
jgi:pimeloyl-ACP methyl ester carboxylesterase